MGIELGILFALFWRSFTERAQAGIAFIEKMRGGIGLGIFLQKERKGELNLQKERKRELHLALFWRSLIERMRWVLNLAFFDRKSASGNCFYRKNARGNCFYRKNARGSWTWRSFGALLQKERKRELHLALFWRSFIV